MVAVVARGLHEFLAELVCWIGHLYLGGDNIINAFVLRLEVEATSCAILGNSL